MISSNLDYILNTKAIKPYKLSKETGLPRSFISALIDDTFQTLNIEQVDKLCSYLHISYHELFFFSPIFVDFGSIEHENKQSFSFTVTLNFPYGLINDYEVDAETYTISLPIKLKGELTTEIDAHKGEEVYFIDITNDDYDKYCYTMFGMGFNGYTGEEMYRCLDILSDAIAKYVKKEMNDKRIVEVSGRFMYDDREFDDTLTRLKIAKNRLEEKIKELESE